MENKLIRLLNTHETTKPSVNRTRTYLSNAKWIKKICQNWEFRFGFAQENFRIQTEKNSRHRGFFPCSHSTHLNLIIENFTWADLFGWLLLLLLLLYILSFLLFYVLFPSTVRFVTAFLAVLSIIRIQNRYLFSLCFGEISSESRSRTQQNARNTKDGRLNFCNIFFRCFSLG